MPNPWEQYDTPSETTNAPSSSPWDSFGDSGPSYGYIEPEQGATTESINFGVNGETVQAPVGTGLEFSKIQDDDVFDTPASSFEEAGAQFEKQAAYISLVANAFGLIGDDEVNGFIADRSKALASAQSRQPRYMKEFTRQWEESKGIFEGTGVILSNPRAIGRQVITQSANAAIPLMTTAGGTFAGASAGSAVPVVGTVIGGVAGGTAGAFVGGSIVEVGAELDGMISEAGYDIADPDSVLSALENDALMESIRIKAAKKGLTTASVDALFQVVGGRFLKAAKVKGAGKVGTAVAGTADVAVQSVGEGLGEAAGQFAKDGTVNVKDAVLEAVTSVGQSVGQTAIGATVGQTKEVASAQLGKALNTIEEKASKRVQAAIETDSITDTDVNSIDIELESAERDIISAIGENQIIEADIAQQAEITSEATDVKAQSDSISGVDVSKPQSLKKALGRVPETLSQFIKREGGIVDKAGELASRDVNTKSGVGIIRKGPDQDGQATLDGSVSSIPDNANIDFIRDKAFKAGYFSDKATADDVSHSELFDAIASDINNERVYTETDRLAIDELTQGQQKAEQSLFERGIESGMSVEDIANVIRGERDLGNFAPTQKADIDAMQKDIEAKRTPERNESVQQAKDDVQGLQSGSLLDNDGFFSGRLSGVADFASGVSSGFGKALVPISTRIKNISPKLFVRIRKFEFDVKVAHLKDNALVQPFLKKFNKLDADTQIELDLALKNADQKTINTIGETFNMKEEISQVKVLLDDMFARAKEAGVKVDYKGDFFPRKVKDVNGLIDYFMGQDYWNVIQDAIDKKESVSGKTLNDIETVALINNMMRGRPVDGVSLAQRGVFKGRSIETITDEINKFYETSDQALLAYIGIANEAVAISTLFGKGHALDGSQDIQDSVGSFIGEMIKAKEITSREAKILKDILEARFNQGRMGSIFAAARDLSYIDTMGSPLNAITQFGDVTTSLYNSGVLNTLSTVGSAITDKTAISLSDIGFDDMVAQEFDNGNMTSEWVNKVFKATGLQKMDRVGKLTLVNSAIKDFAQRAKKGDPALVKQLDLMFGNEAGQAMQDLKDGVMSDNIKFLAFNTLLDMQPVALSEMPEYYLRSGNLKILYMLKSFTLKQLDIYRREVATNLSIARKTNDKKLAAKAMGNFVRLAGFWISMGATADFMKDLLRSALGGDETEEPESYLVDNALKAFGFSKYQLDQVTSTGPFKESVDDVVLNMIAPPRKFIQNVQRDYAKQKKDGLTLDNSRSIRSIPVGGELYYFWFGGGSDQASKSKSGSGLFNE